MDDGRFRYSPILLLLRWTRVKLIDALLETAGSLPPRRNGLACDRCNHAHCPVMNLGGTGCCCAYAAVSNEHTATLVTDIASIDLALRSSK